MSILDFINSGPQRRAWLDENVSDFVEYITPPNLRPTVEMAAQMNPIQGMSDSMQQFGVATDPSRSMEDRRNAAIGSAVEGLLAVAPAALAAKGYMTPAQGMMEGLLGGSPASAQIGDDLGRFWADETGAIRVWHGSPHDFDKFSMDRIGTGEGAQAYGHGLYFAENDRVARDYARRLGGYSEDAQQGAATVFRHAGEDRGAAILRAQDGLESVRANAEFAGPEHAEAWAPQIRKWEEIVGIVGDESVDLSKLRQATSTKST
mgnify:CR=1 FL=1